MRLAAPSHARYIQFRLCPLKGTSTSAEKASLSEACLAKYTLRNANNQNKLWLYRGRPGWRFVSTLALRAHLLPEL